MHTHLAAYAVRHRHADFIDVNHQRLPVPMQLTGANGELLIVTLAMPGAALGHGPTLGVFAVKRDIQCAVIVRLSVTARSVPRVIRRKHTAYKRDDGQPMVTVIT